MWLIAAQGLVLELEHHIPDGKHAQAESAALQEQIDATRVIPIDYEQLTPELAPVRGRPYTQFPYQEQDSAGHPQFLFEGHLCTWHRRIGCGLLIPRAARVGLICT